MKWGSDADLKPSYGNFVESHRDRNVKLQLVGHECKQIHVELFQILIVVILLYMGDITCFESKAFVYM